MRNIILPKGLSILLLFSCLSVFQTMKAQDAKSTLTIQLKNKNWMTVQACSDEIFRIRVSAESNPGPALMERYGILKSD